MPLTRDQIAARSVGRLLTDEVNDRDCKYGLVGVEVELPDGTRRTVTGVDWSGNPAVPLVLDFTPREQAGGRRFITDAEFLAMKFDPPTPCTGVRVVGPWPVPAGLVLPGMADPEGA